ncbi:transposase [Microvirga splendida]|uniref:Transposase n=1 Tax=Microvirga splendida TaxID=2795727 RepID=A0ABS0Y7G4_9HYPH|nr:transposase [Microvirga splendida]
MRAPLLASTTRRGRPRKHDLRLVLNAILYILRGGEPWRLLPHEYPFWQSVYDHFRRCRGGPRQDPVGPQPISRRSTDYQPKLKSLDATQVPSRSAASRGYRSSCKGEKVPLTAVRPR